MHVIRAWREACRFEGVHGIALLGYSTITSWRDGIDPVGDYRKWYLQFGRTASDPQALQCTLVVAITLFPERLVSRYRPPPAGVLLWSLGSQIG